MTTKLEIVTRLKSLSSDAISEFVSSFGSDIKRIIVDNGGSDTLLKANLLNVISELVFRLKSRISFDEYDADTLVNTLSYLFLIKDRSNKKKPIIYSVRHYDMRSIKLLSYDLISDDKKCEDIVNNIGEPGRTILKLSFYENNSDREIAEHVQFESTELLQQRRVKLVERCSENLY